MLDALCKIALGVVERWVRLLFLSVGRAALYFFFNCPLFYYSFQLEKNKVLYLGEKQVPIALGKTTGALAERWTGGTKKSAKRSDFFLIGVYWIGWCFSMAFCKALIPVCLYFSVVSNCLCPANSCTILKSFPLVKRLVITLCLMVIEVSFLANCF